MVLRVKEFLCFVRPCYRCIGLAGANDYTLIKWLFAYYRPIPKLFYSIYNRGRINAWHIAFICLCKHAAVIEAPYYLKLIGAVLVEERDRHPHHAVVVARDGIGVGHLDSIVIVIARVRLLEALPLDLLVPAVAQILLYRHQL